MKKLMHLRFLLLVALCPVLHADNWNWCYTNKKCGPRTWARISRACSGLRQSPINIQTSRAIEKSSRRPLRIERPFHRIRATLVNNGHNYHVVPHYPVLMYGGGLPGIFRLLQFHFHFGDGSRLDRGSEHTINHRAYPVEMHLVFWNIKYRSSEVAVKSPEGLSVLAVFFKVTSRSNPALDPIVKLLPHVGYKGQTRTLSLNLDKIIPWEIETFYRYKGSLTTPPCTENVIWTVVKKPMHMCISQYKTFVNTLTWDSNIYRPVQPLNGRKVAVYDD
ncbi:carbonic anhydrase 2-like [Heterodontus francisci]|uniref:carbonic anhydrase 2-like n=1 Tax=Heterodontus francisci TaxID=7792 RepID=UPI00355B8E1E